jgi:hypothetical protein
MEYWLIFGAMLVALAPLQYFWPSKRQRGLVHLREQAAIMGLFVELRKLPDHRLVRLSIPEDQRADWVFYGLRLSPEADVTVGTWIRIDHEWISATAESSLPESLQSLPSGCDVVSIRPGCIGFTGRRTSPMNNC